MSKETVTLNSGTSSCKIHLFGATVISWLCKGKERLFLSTDAIMDGSKAIRGGVPIVFPNFGPWKCGPQHGIARISWWKVVVQPVQLDNGDTQVVLELTDDEKSRKIWNYCFKLQYTVTLSSSTLTSSLQITNTSTTSFDFTTLLHTYIRVDDIKDTTVSGLEGCAYKDKVTSSDGIEQDTEVKISMNVDRVYMDTKHHVVTHAGGRIQVEKEGLPDTVLWNPWIEKSQAMSDFNNDGWMNMICVEPGFVGKRKVLGAGEEFGCKQTLTVLE